MLSTLFSSYFTHFPLKVKKGKASVSTEQTVAKAGSHLYVAEGSISCIGIHNYIALNNTRLWISSVDSNFMSFSVPEIKITCP